MSASRNAHAEGTLEDADARQFLTFRLAGEEYGVGILSVQEIRGWSPVTSLMDVEKLVTGADLGLVDKTID